MKKHICFVAGKSGGHILPCLTMAHHIKHDHASTTITLISTNTELDRTLAQHPNIDYALHINLNNVPRTIFAYPLFLLRLTRAFFISLHHFIRQRPQKLISTGGYISIPAVLAARILRIPVELWELNVTPGKAMKLLAPIAQKTYVCFRETIPTLKNACYKPYPIRYGIQDKYSPTSCITSLNLDPTRITLFIIGGSQGSHELNHLIKNFVANHTRYHSIIQIIHQTGNDDHEIIRTFYTSHNIPSITFSYQDKLATIFNAAGIIISRAGAGTLAEIAFFEKQCIVVPLITKHNNHQLYNARAYVNEHAPFFVCAHSHTFNRVLTKMLNKHPLVIHKS
jgi:UDP-N-acetylglucosamine--N-acetylmuramyl-(pentapeptide) pyrophosphoryl-undecaprenol N-acetylglucosamine transferase